MMSEPDVPAGGGWEGMDLAGIWEASRDILHAQLTAIERAVVAGIERRLDLDDQRAAGREAHKLAGSLGTFGFENGSRLARTLELALAPDRLLDPAQALALSRVVLDLQVETDRPLATQPPTAVPSPAGALGPALLVVDGHLDRARRMVEAAAAQGVRASFVSTLAAAGARVGSAPPEVVVVDSLAGGEEEVAAFLAEMAGCQPPVATLVMVGHAGVDERVNAARLGAQVVLEKPVSPDSVIQAALRLLVRGRDSATVLVLEDDPTFLVQVREVLEAQGIAVRSLDDSQDLWAALEAIDPDLLLLDNDMPGVYGVSLCGAIRGDERWARLPVVFLSGSGSPEGVRTLFAAGADDFVPKPVLAENLVTRVVNRIERTRVQTERPDVDLATGLQTSRTFTQDATRLLGLARHDDRPAVLVLIELDPPRPAAIAAFGRVLRQSAAAEDAVGTWSDGRVAALLYGVSAVEAKDRLGRIVQAARAAEGDAPSRALVGLAASLDHASDLRALGVAAERAVERARGARGTAIEIHESGGQSPTDVVDVLLVDDDEALGTLVVHALSGRGWRVRWLRDGAEAMELLENPTFLARAVLLDVGLPGLDGLSVLRRLGQGGRLEATRVVMLTVRANEGEVLEALELGAFDHVAKPFSLSVLMHRVRRAVDG